MIMCTYMIKFCIKICTLDTSFWQHIGVFFMQSFEALRLETRKPDIIQSTKLGQGSFGVVVKCVVPDHLEFVKKKVSTLILFITET